MKNWITICFGLMGYFAGFSQTTAITKFYKCKTTICTGTESIELSEKGTFKIKESNDAVSNKTVVLSGNWELVRDTLTLIAKDKGPSRYVYRNAINVTFLVSIDVDNWDNIAADLDSNLKKNEDYIELGNGATPEEIKKRPMFFYLVGSDVARQVLYEKPPTPYNVYINKLN